MVRPAQRGHWNAVQACKVTTQRDPRLIAPGFSTYLLAGCGEQQRDARVSVECAEKWRCADWDLASEVPVETDLASSAIERWPVRLKMMIWTSVLMLCASCEGHQCRALTVNEMFRAF